MKRQGKKHEAHEAGRALDSGKKIIIPEHIAQSMANVAAQKVQAFTNEAGQRQARRMELFSLIISAQTQKLGAESVDLALCKSLADGAVRIDEIQKWTELAALFKELGLRGPQPHLEWAARQAGVTLFEAEESAPLVRLAEPVETAEGSQ